MFAWAAAPIALLAASTSLWGLEGGALLVGQALLSVLMLEAANYVQHYGLQRTKLDNGRQALESNSACAGALEPERSAPAPACNLASWTAANQHSRGFHVRTFEFSNLPLATTLQSRLQYACTAV